MAWNPKQKYPKNKPMNKANECRVFVETFDGCKIDRKKDAKNKAKNCTIKKLVCKKKSKK